MEVIGITGNMATGKSTVAHFLSKLGLPVIDADGVARQVVAPKSTGLKQLAVTFGGDIVTAAGTLVRRKLAQRAFATRQATAQLNAIMQPLIKQEMRTQLAAQTAPVVVLDVPLLFEFGYDKWCDWIIVTTAPSAVQIDRIKQRDGLTALQAKQRLAHQMPAAKQRAWADLVVVTTQSVDATAIQVSRALRAWGVLPTLRQFRKQF